MGKTYSLMEPNEYYAHNNKGEKPVYTQAT